MTNLCEKPGVKISENLVKNSVNINPAFKNMCKSRFFSPFFDTFLTLLFNNYSTQSHLKIYSHFHNTYNNYYDIFKINNTNNRKV